MMIVNEKLLQTLPQPRLKVQICTSLEVLTKITESLAKILPACQTLSSINRLYLRNVHLLLTSLLSQVIQYSTLLM